MGGVDRDCTVCCARNALARVSYDVLNGSCVKGIRQCHMQGKTMFIFTCKAKSVQNAARRRPLDITFDKAWIVDSCADGACAHCNDEAAKSLLQHNGHIVSSDGKGVENEGQSRMGLSCEAMNLAMRTTMPVNLL